MTDTPMALPPAAKVKPVDNSPQVQFDSDQALIDGVIREAQPITPYDQPAARRKRNR